MNINKIVISGRLVKDPEIKTISEIELCTFRFASNRIVGKKKIEKSIFIDVNVWGGQAQVCKKFLKKGSRVIIDGILNQDSWKDQNNETTSKIYIEADNVVFLDSYENNKTEENTNDQKNTTKEIETKKIINKKELNDEDLPF